MAIAVSRYQWHSRVHKEWGKERLYFWRLRFQPVYERGAVIDRLQEVFEEMDIASYAVYELFGEADLLLRVWLKTAHTATDLKDKLHERIRELNLSHAEHFSVSKILRHWVWDDEGLAPPSNDRLLEPLPDHHINQVNMGRATRSTLSTLTADGLLAETLHIRGIKFAMVITAPVQELSLDQQNDLRRRVTEIVEQADRIQERSLYQGSGFGLYLLLGRVDYDHFDDIRRQLADPINTGVVPASIGARTYTMIVPGQDFLLFQDILPLAKQIRDDEDFHAEQVLRSDESSKIEVKASAYLDYNRLLLGDGRREKNDEWTTEGVLRAVCALLNTEGGTVVVGALEQRRFPRLGPFAEAPKIGRYICVGVEPDYFGRDWDRYELDLQKLFRDRIKDKPGLWLNVTREAVQGVDVAKIYIRQPDRDWYYLDGRRFFVRQGGATIELDGPDADNWRRAHPRG